MVSYRLLAHGEWRKTMAYQAIYRKWRPLVFEDIVGQNHITQTLKNQILSGKVAHAYLFCGTRGTGKTTAAKIFARAVNCLNNTSGSPCNECDICTGILNGDILDVTEIDAASNNGVENIREIREDVRYVTTSAKYRVFIIDEVHMLSQGAFNALLKTLEEPPEHVIFIMATTEVHKVPQTILSRCQRFDFKRIKPSDIILRIKEIAYKDGIQLSDDGYETLARLADGSMRDGLSILERLVSACGNHITAQNIIDTLGLAESELSFRMADAIAQQNPSSALEIIDQLLADGKDLNTFIDTVIQHFRNLLVCKISSAPEELIEYSAEELLRLKSQAEKLSFEKISHAASALSEAKAEAKWVKAPRVIYELTLVKLCRLELDDSKEALLDRLSSMEEKIKNGITIKTESSQEPPPEKKAVVKKEKKPSARLYHPFPPGTLHSENPIVIAAKKWDRIVQMICKSKPYLIAPLNNHPITIDAEGIIILYQQTEKTSKSIAQTYIHSIEEGFEKASGTNCRIKTAFADELEDYMVDFWNLPSPEGTPASEENTEAPLPLTQTSAGKDPLDDLTENFPEIVELTDDSEFVGYNTLEEDFSQSSFDEEEREEEFLEENELS